MLEIAAGFWLIGKLIPIILLVAVLAFFGVVRFRKYLRQNKCSHDRWYETQACDAICNDCSKNLGFIGTVREKRGVKGERR